MNMTRRVHGDELCEFHMGNYLENCERMIEFLKFELDYFFRFEDRFFNYKYIYQ